MRFLLDENISPVVTEQVRLKTPTANIHSVQQWRGGEFLSADDASILVAAYEEQLGLVTCDLSSILPLLKVWGEEGRAHAGVIFIDDKSIANSNIGGLVTAILQALEQLEGTDFTNGVLFLRAVR